MSDLNRDLSVRCPRCGYDQRGVIAAWTDSCPLQGTCSECGLELQWSAVFDPGKTEPSWCVEYAGSRRIVPAALSTALRTCWPWRFWRRLRMEHRVRPRRLLTYVLLLLLLLVVVNSGAQVAGGLRNRQMAMRAVLWAQPAMARQVQAMQSSNVDWGPQLNALRADATIAPSYAESATVAALKAAIYPLAADRGFIVWGSGRRDQFTVGGVFGWAAHGELPIEIIGLLAGVCCVVLFPVSLLLLPISLRRAKVRIQHIVRISAYGLIIPIGVIGLCQFLFGFTAIFYWSLASAKWGETILMGIGVVTRWLLLIAIPLLLVVWWSCAIRRYLKVPHGFLTSLMLTMLCGLVTISAAYVLFNQWFIGRFLL